LSPKTAPGSLQDGQEEEVAAAAAAKEPVMNVFIPQGVRTLRLTTNPCVDRKILLKAQPVRREEEEEEDDNNTSDYVACSHFLGNEHSEDWNGKPDLLLSTRTITSACGTKSMTIAEECSLDCPTTTTTASHPQCRYYLQDQNSSSIVLWLPPSTSYVHFAEDVVSKIYKGKTKFRSCGLSLKKTVVRFDKDLEHLSHLRASSQDYFLLPTAADDDDDDDDDTSRTDGVASSYLKSVIIEEPTDDFVFQPLDLGAGKRQQLPQSSPSPIPFYLRPQSLPNLTHLSIDTTVVVRPESLPRSLVSLKYAARMVRGKELVGFPESLKILYIQYRSKRFGRAADLPRGLESLNVAYYGLTSKVSIYLFEERPMIPEDGNALDTDVQVGSFALTSLPPALKVLNVGLPVSTPIGPNDLPETLEVLLLHFLKTDLPRIPPKVRYLLIKGPHESAAPVSRVGKIPPGVKELHIEGGFIDQIFAPANLPITTTTTTASAIPSQLEVLVLSCIHKDFSFPYVLSPSVRTLGIPPDSRRILRAGSLPAPSDPIPPQHIHHRHYHDQDRPYDQCTPSMPPTSVAFPSLRVVVGLNGGILWGESDIVEAIIAEKGIGRGDMAFRQDRMGATLQAIVGEAALVVLRPKCNPNTYHLQDPVFLRPKCNPNTYHLQDPVFRPSTSPGSVLMINQTQARDRLAKIVHKKLNEKK
jgi:hypothetical protein